MTYHIPTTNYVGKIEYILYIDIYIHTHTHIYGNPSKKVITLWSPNLFFLPEDAIEYLDKPHWPNCYGGVQEKKLGTEDTAAEDDVELLADVELVADVADEGPEKLDGKALADTRAWRCDVV